QKSLAAYALLLRAERHWPAHRPVLRMLTQLYRDDADAPRARAALLLQEHLAPVHGALALLSLETSIGETSRAEAVFDRLEAKLTGPSLRQHLPAIERTAAPLTTRSSQ